MDEIFKEAAQTGVIMWVSKDLIPKLLGPTADYLGQETKNLVEKGAKNIGDIFKRAINKLGDRIDDEGVINSRVVKQVWDEGRFCEDEIVKEYFGGVLAAARTKDGKDDSGLPIIGVIKNLSRYQIRFHYIIYTIVRKLFSGEAYSLSMEQDREKMRVFIPMEVFFTAMDLDEYENKEWMIQHCVIGLVKQSLIDPFYQWGNETYLTQKCYVEIKEAGIVVQPSIFGGEIFKWAFGYCGVSVNQLLESSLVLNDDLKIMIPTGYSPLINGL